MSVSVFVGGLAYATSAESLQSQFSAVAPVENVSVPRDRTTGKPRGFAFVQVADDAAAQAIIDAFDGKSVDGRTIRLNRAEPQAVEEKKLFVGGLTSSATSEALREFLAASGSVVKADVIIDRETGSPRGFAFVEVASSADADAIIAACDGAQWQGSALSVRRARPQSEKPQRRDGGSRGPRRDW